MGRSGCPQQQYSQAITKNKSYSQKITNNHKQKILFTKNHTKSQKINPIHKKSQVITKNKSYSQKITNDHKKSQKSQAITKKKSYSQKITNNHKQKILFTKNHTKSQKINPIHKKSQVITKKKSYSQKITKNQKARMLPDLARFGGQFPRSGSFSRCGDLVSRSGQIWPDLGIWEIFFFKKKKKLPRSGQIWKSGQFFFSLRFLAIVSQGKGLSNFFFRP